MNLSELARLIELHQTNKYAPDAEVRIVVKKPFDTIGGTPSVPVESAHMGFDWDHGKFLIYPEESVMEYDTDFGEKFRELQKKNGDLHYENMGLKTEVKRLKKLLNSQQDNL